MKKLMFLTMMFGLMIVFTGSVSAQKSITKVGDGRVLTFFTQSAKVDSVPRVGDSVVTSFNISDGKFGLNFGLKRGDKYTRLAMDQKGKGQLYFYYLVSVPTIAEQINNKSSKVNVVCTDTKPWTIDDKVIVTIADAPGGGKDVRFSVPDKGCFIFNVN